MKRISVLVASIMSFTIMLSAQTKETAVLFSGIELDESFLLSENVSVRFNAEGNGEIFKGETKVGEFEIGVGNYTSAEFKDAFKLTAYQDPDNVSDYYTTFFTSEGAYKVPETSKAYAGTIENEEKTDVLKLTDIGNIIHVKEPVILRVKPGEVATGSINITLMPSCNKDDASTENILEGTDEEKSLGANQYALSLGQSGVGFYLWDGEIIGANKAYMTLGGDDVAGIKAFTFQFDNGETTGINNVNVNSVNDNYFNLNGMRVDDNYKGIVIKNGKKVLRK
ncbi:MAG: hypothetical protein MJZ20_14645 [Bacteroidaceae bacterium]|nr:hypothetical protein [Bacteroidaceae bacterium]